MDNEFYDYIAAAAIKAATELPRPNETKSNVEYKKRWKVGRDIYNSISGGWQGMNDSMDRVFLFVKNEQGKFYFSLQEMSKGLMDSYRNDGYILSGQWHELPLSTTFQKRINEFITTNDKYVTYLPNNARLLAYARDPKVRINANDFGRNI